MAKEVKLDKLLQELEDGNQDAAPEDHRSKRRQLDLLLRAMTNRYGQLRFNGSATGILQWNLLRANGATGVGSFDIFVTSRFDRNTLLFLDVEAAGGNGADVHVPSFSSLNGDVEPPDARFHAKELWLEVLAFDEAVTITFGKIDLSNYFDNNLVANDETSQFISAAFINSPGIPFPAQTPGIRVRTTLFNRFFLQAGVVSEDNSGDELFSALYKMGSVGFKLFEESPHEGNLRLYGYSHPVAASSPGYGFSYDQSLGEKLKGFFRWTRNGAELSTSLGIRNSWSTGLALMLSVHDIPVVLGAAFSEIVPDSPVLMRERQCEAYVRLELDNWTSLSAHTQNLWNVWGSPGIASLLGLRAQLHF